MKFIHCADLHLDSKMNANLDKESAKERKSEILHTFEKLVLYASKNNITAILIAGDMFDTKNISATTRNTVLHHIDEHSGITFYYLKGNHDNDNFLSGLEQIPDNLKMFGANWTTYNEADGKISISGIELSTENAGSAYVSLVLDSKKFNIVMLHGQESEGKVKDKAEIINLKALYCYPGCLEGRGFDECGEHGFVVIDVDEETGKYTHEFVIFAQRKLYTVNVDVTGCQTTAEMVSRISQDLQEAGCENNSLVKIVLKGMLDVECEKDVHYLQARFKERFYYVKVYDETTLKIDIEDYLYDESLKREYVRQVMADDSISEEDKKIIIRFGLQAIAGEEVQ